MAIILSVPLSEVRAQIRGRREERSANGRAHCGGAKQQAEARKTADLLK